jgi:hypothetical protein
LQVNFSNFYTVHLEINYTVTVAACISYSFVLNQ